MTNYIDDLDDELGWRDDDVPSAPLSLTTAQRVALAAAIEAGLREHGCDGTLRQAQVWAAAEGQDWPALRMGLQEHGGYCDCEVLLNVLPDQLDRD